MPVFGRRKRHFVGYLAIAMFKMRYADVKKRFHVFLNEAGSVRLAVGGAPTPARLLG